MLPKLQEVIFSKLLHLISAFDLVSVATRLDSERVKQIEVAEHAQSGAILLILFISKLAVVVLEVGGEVVEDHRESLYHLLLRRVIVDWSVAEN